MNAKQKKVVELVESMVRKALNESITEFPKEEAKFFDELKKLESINKLSSVYNMDTDDIIKRLKSRIVVLRYNDKKLKQISIDFTDTNTGIEVKLMHKY